MITWTQETDNSITLIINDERFTFMREDGDQIDEYCQGFQDILLGSATKKGAIKRVLEDICEKYPTESGPLMTKMREKKDPHALS
jgi:hypothetical protein